MPILNYSSFLNLIKEHYSYDINKEILAENLLCEITDEDFHENIDSTMLSRFWTGERELNSEIRNNIDVQLYKKKCVEYFKTVIYRSLFKLIR